MSIKALIVAATLASAGMVQATTLTATLPEFSGDGTISAQTVGTFTFTIPTGEHVVAASIRGQFGNSVTNSTAVQTEYLDGVAVANCADSSAFCWTTGPEAWSYTFSWAQFGIFADNAATLVANQTDCCVVRLGESTLTLETAVPEPASWALMIAGFGMVGFAMRRRTAIVAA